MTAIGGTSSFGNIGRSAFKRRTSFQQRVVDSSTFVRKTLKNFDRDDKPAKYAKLVEVIVLFILAIPNIEAELRPKQRMHLMGDEGMEIDGGDMSSGDEDDGNLTGDVGNGLDELRYLDSVEPFWDRKSSAEGGGGGNGYGRDLAFGRRKIAFFDCVTAQHRHFARSILKRMILSEDITKELLEELIAEHRQDEVALSSAILMEALEMNRISSLEGLDKCYSGLVDAGSGIVSNEGGENVKHIIHSITILFLTTLPNQTGDTLHVLGKLYNLCGTPRYRRRFVTRIAPLLLRPSNSAPWSIEHRNDMESILAVVQLIFNQITGTVFGEKQWYRRGQSLREDEERQHTISLAAAYLQSLHESDITGLSDNGSYHSSQNGPHEMHEKLDMLIRGAIHGMTSGEVGYSVVGATLVKKKAPMSPRVKLPHQQSSHEVNTPSATLEHSPPVSFFI